MQINNGTNTTHQTTKWRPQPEAIPDIRSRDVKTIYRSRSRYSYRSRLQSRPRRPPEASPRMRRRHFRRGT